MAGPDDIGPASLLPWPHVDPHAAASPTHYPCPVLDPVSVFDIGSVPDTGP